MDRVTGKILEKECRNMYYIMSHSFVEYRI